MKPRKPSGRVPVTSEVGFLEEEQCSPWVSGMKSHPDAGLHSSDSCVHLALS